MRRLSITNRGDRPREIEVTSYAEIVLARPRTTSRIPAFGKLFIETEYDAAERRPAVQPAPAQRRRGIRPGRSTCSASKAVSAARSNGKRIARDSSAADARPPTRWRSTAARCRARPARCSIRSRRCASACGWRRAHSCASPSRPVSRRIAMRRWRWSRKYRDGSAASRAFSMAFTHVHITLQHLGLTDDQAMLVRSAGVARLRLRRSCISPADLAPTRFGQPNLWGYGISGRPADRAGVASTEADAAAARAPGAATRRNTGASRACAPTSSSSTSIPPTTSTRCSTCSTALVQEPRWGGWLDKTGRHVPAAIRRACPTPTGVCSLRSRAGRPAGELGDLAPQLDRHAPWLFEAHVGAGARRFAPPRPADAPAGRPAARHGERPRRLHARRPRVCRRARRRPRDAAAVVERDRQPGVRHHREQRRARRSRGPRTAARTG